MDGSKLTALLLVVAGLAFVVVPVAGADKAQQYIEQGSALAAQKRHLEAIQAFTLAIKADPKRAEAYRLRAVSRKADGDYKEAVKDYDKAIELDPGSSKAYNGRGEAKLNLKDDAGALADISKAVELDPRNANALTNLGRVNQEAGNLPGALASYNHAIKADPKNSSAWWWRAKVRTEMNDGKGAIADYTEAIKLSPGTGSAYNNRGACRERLGDLDGAAADYRKELEINPGDNVTLANLTRVEGILDKRDAASRTPAAGPRGTATAGSRAAPPPIDTSAWLPKVLTTKVPDEPCKANEVFGKDVPWQPGLTSAPKPVGPAPAGGIKPFDGINADTATRPEDAVSAAIEAMRLLIGPMSRDEEGVFNKKWFPLRDFPTPEVVDYLSQLNPLLGQLLSLRGAIVVAAKGFDDSWSEVTTAAMMDAEGPARDGLTIAQQNRVLLEALSAQAKEIAAQIEALGNPPDPWAQKCAARKAHEDAVEAVLALGTRDDSGLEGEWEGAIGATPTRDDELCPFLADNAFYVLTWVIRMKDDTWIGHKNEEVPILVMYMLHGCSPDSAQRALMGRFVWTNLAQLENTKGASAGPDPASASSDTEASWLKKAAEYNKQLRQDYSGTYVEPRGKGRGVLHYERGKTVQLDRVDTEDSTIGGLSGADARRKRAEAEELYRNEGLTPRYHAKSGAADVLEDWVKKRAQARAVLSGWRPEPPPGLLAFDLIRWLDSEYAKRVQPTGALRRPAKGQSPAAQQAARARTADEQAALELKQERIAFHRSAIAIIEANMRRDQEELAKETRAEKPDVLRCGELDFRILQAASNIQAEHDQIATIESGSLVYTRSPFDDYAHARFVDKIEADADELVGRYQRAQASTQRLIDTVSRERPELREELQKIADRSLGPGAVRSLDPAVPRGVLADVRRRVDAYHRVERAKALGDEAFWDRWLTEAEQVKAVADYTLTGCAMLGGPGALMVAYHGASGTLEAGPKEGVLRAADWISKPAYLAAQTMRGYEQGGFRGAAGGLVQAYLIGKAFDAGTGIALRASARLFKKTPSLTFHEAQQLSQHRKAQYDGRVAVEDFQAMQKGLGDALSRGAKGAELAEIKRRIRDQVALIHESPEAKMFLKNLTSGAGRAGLTRASAEHLTQAYSLHLTEVHQRVAFEFNAVMAAKGFNPQKLREFRNSASTGSVGMDHDIGLIEKPWFVRGLSGRKKLDPWLTCNGKVTTVNKWQKEATKAWAQAYKRTTGRNPHKSFEEATSSGYKESYRDLAWLGKEGSKIADINKVRKGWAQQAADVTSVKARGMLFDPKLGLTQMQRVSEAGRGMAKDMGTKLMPAIDRAIKKAPGDAKRLGAIKKHWSEVSAALEKAHENPIEAMRKVRMLTGGKDLVQVIHELNELMAGFGQAVGK